MAEVLKVDNQIKQSSDGVVVNKKINDITGVIRKFNHYKSLIPADLPFFDQPLQYVQNFGGGLDLGYELIRSYLEEKEIQNFVDVINKNAKQSAEITTKQYEDEIKLHTAKIEANLKGLKLNLDLNSMKTTLNEFKDQEINILTDAINKSLVEVSDNKIPTEIYAERVLEAVKEKLPNSFSSEKLAQCKQFIHDGQKNKKTSIESKVDKEKISQATENVVNQLIDELNKNTQANKILEPIVKRFTPLLENTNEKLVKKTGVILKSLDPTYLTENSAKIVAELKEVDDKGTSVWEKFKSIFTGKDYLEERFEQSVNKYAALSDEYVKKEINDKIFSNALTNEQIAAGLTKFMNKTIEPKEVNNLNLVELRKINPRGFDKTVFEDSKQFVSNSKPQEVKVKPPVATPNLSTKNQNKEIG